MKVLKVDKQDWKKQVACRACKAVLEIVGEDIRYGLYVYGENERKGDYYVECGNCTRPVVIKERDIPGYITDEVRESRSDS
jgi:hypothetical protein